MTAPGYEGFRRSALTMNSAMLSGLGSLNDCRTAFSVPRKTMTSTRGDVAVLTIATTQAVGNSAAASFRIRSSSPDAKRPSRLAMGGKGITA